jgi:hypothetical protein
MRHQAMARCFTLGILLALFGCNKPIDSTAGAANSPSDENSTSPTAEERNPAERRPEPVKPILIEAGTMLAVTIDQPISSKTNSVGDHFDASVASPITVDGKEVIPVGAKCSGTVTQAKSAGRFKGGAELDVTLDSIMVKGKNYEIQTTSAGEAGKGRGKRTAVGAGGGAAVGAIIGALAGGGKGAAIGAGAGAGAGTAGAAFTGNRDITLAAETRLNFKLTQALEVKRRGRVG